MNWQIAICMGLDFSQEETGEALGYARGTISAKIAKEARFFDIAVPFVSTLRERHFRARITEIVGPAEDRIKRLFDRSFQLTERLIEKAHAKGDDATAEELMEIHKNITVWASKFAASEAPKRIKHEGGQTLIHAHVIGLEEAQNLLAARSMMAPALPPAEAIEAELADT